MKHSFLNIKIQNQEDQPIAIIDIDGVIGEDYFSEESNSKQNIKSQLQEISDLDVDKIIVNISSLGGSVDHGLAIHDLLASHDAEVETRVIGMTASAGTIIAQAGDKRVISDNALYLIHLARVYSLVNSFSINTLYNDLEKIDDRIANIYSKASGKDKQTFLDLMMENNGDGIWLSSDEALEKGLVDEISEPLKKVACDRSVFNRLGIPEPENIDQFINTSETESESNKVIGKVDVEVDSTQLREMINELDQILSDINNDADDASNTSEESEISDAEARERELYLIKSRN